MKRIFLIPFFLLTMIAAQADISGQTNATLGSTSSYSVLDVDWGTSWSWEVIGGTINSTNKRSGIAPPGSPPLFVYSVSVTWSSAGAGVVRFKVSGDIQYSMNVLVCLAMGSPTGVSSSIACGPTGSITITGTPGTNGNSLNFYTSNTGGTPSATGLSWSTTANVASTFYVATLSTSTGCQSVMVAVTPTIASLPSTPGAPTSDGSTCGSSVLTRGAPPGGVTWYWQDTNSSGTSTSNSSSTYSAISTGTYYLRAQDNTAGCWSASSSSVSVTLNFSPIKPSNPTSDGSTCGSTVLTRGTPPSGVTWYWQDTDPSGTGTNFPGPTYTASASGTYYLRSMNNSTGCWSPSSSITVTLNPFPSTPSSPTIQSNCITAVLAMGSVPGGETWYWQGTNSSGVSTSNSSSTFNVSSNGTYYLRSQSSAGCWSAGSSSVSVTLNALPSAPSSPTIQSNCGTEVIARGTPPGGVTWYWQDTNSSGTSTSNSSATYSTSVSGTYYLRGRDNTTLCWSNSTAIALSVQTIPNASAGNQNIFSGQQTSIAITNPNSVPGTTFSWTAPAQTNVTGGQPGSGSTIAQTLTTPGSGTATYTITPSANGCAGSPVTATATVFPAATVTSVGTPAVVIGSTASLQATSGYTSYQWVKNGTDIAGATASTYSATAAADYAVRVTITGGASATSTTFTVYAMGMQPDATVNAELTTILRKPGVTNTTDLYALQPSEYKQSIVYVDKLARPVQTIAIGQSPLQKDIITPMDYDTLTPTAYLGYVSSAKNGLRQTTAIAGSGGSYTTSDQYLFYQQTTAKIATSTAPFAKAVYESSPSRRLIEQGSTGTDWQPGTGGALGAHTTKSEVHTNAANDVKIYTANGPGSYYAAGVLLVRKGIDANGNSTLVYTDKMGRTVLKREQIDATIEGVNLSFLETYYVYDNLGNLVLQVPPKAVVQLNTGTSWSQAFSDQWCFTYAYDHRNRLVTKKTPGTAPANYAYDPLNRLTLVQDGNLNGLHKWVFTKYDAKGRPVMTGLYTNATQTTVATIQTLLDGLYTGTNPFFEERGTTLHGYTNQSFPTANADSSPIEVLAVNYYDNYDFDTNGTDDFSYTVQGITGEGAQGSSFGLPTGSKKVVLNSSTWLYTYQFYDRFGRVIQVRGNNHLSATVDNLSTVVYDFEGKILQTKVFHNAGVNQTTVLKKMSYDHAGRLIKVYQNLNNEPNDQLVAQYNYNELGQAVEKNLHLLYDAQDGQTGTFTADNLVETSYKGETNLIARNSIILSPNYIVTASATPYRAGLTTVTQSQAEANGRYLQSVDYRYDIHGQLTSINNAQLTNDGNTNDDSNDYFGMELLYNTVDSGLSNTGYFNGNISAVKWNPGTTPGTGGERSYKFTYDKTDKLTSSAFNANNGTGWTKESNTLNETMSYDANGNILGLVRNQNQRGLSGTTVTSSQQAIDNLTYTYSSGNQLSKVEDAATTTGGFINGASNTTEYTYTTDGSMTKDDNKGISNITYNVLGKPQQISFTDGRTVVYTYDATGTKLTMASTVGGTTTTTDYVNGFVYTNSALNFFSSPEGRVVKNGSNLEYQYAITDHQGNTRVLFTSAAQAAVPTLADFDADGNDQSSQFTSVPTPVTFSAANHTAGGSKVIRLNQATPIAAGLSKKVYPGDKIDMEVYSYFEATSGYGTSSVSLGGLITAVSGALVNGGPDVGGLKSSGVSNALNGFGAGANQGDTQPAAYLNYILFDANYKVMDAGWQVVPATSFSKQQVTIPQITVKEAGYIFAYLSYEDLSNNFVYFDDFKVTITPTNIIQSNEYYPFGLQTANSWTRDNTTNNFLYNGGTELNSVTNMYDLAFRNYDASLGRFFQSDPLADRYSSYSPYAYANCNPVSFNDPMGLAPKKFKLAGGSISSPGTDVSHWLDHTFDLDPGNGVDGGAWADLSAGGGAQQMLEDADNLTLEAFGEKYGTTYSASNGLVFSIRNGNVGFFIDQPGTTDLSSEDIGEVGAMSDLGTSIVSSRWVSLTSMVANQSRGDGESGASLWPDLKPVFVAAGGVTSASEIGVATGTLQSVGLKSISTIKTGLNTAKWLGRTGVALSIANVGYNVISTGNLKGSDIAGLATTGVLVVGGVILGTAAAPALAVAGLVIGIASYVAEDWLDEQIGTYQIFDRKK